MYRRCTLEKAVQMQIKYEDVRLVRTTNGEFMAASEARILFLSGSMLLVGRK